MVENTKVGSSVTVKPSVVNSSKHKIALFHCVSAIDNPGVPANQNCEITEIPMPCSSMTREIFLLRAFEAGADAVIVIVCPKGTCRYIEGNIRAGKRVARMKKLLDEIGLDSRRLEIFYIQQGDQAALNDAIYQITDNLAARQTSVATPFLALG